MLVKVGVIVIAVCSILGLVLLGNGNNLAHTIENDPVKKVTYLQKNVPVPNTTEKGIVMRVVDGDTFVIRLENNEIFKVRLIGVNAPESVDPRRKVQCYGKEASEYLRSRIENKEVELVRDTSQRNRDKYDRLLRHVFIDSVNIGQQLIEQGFAYEYMYSIPYAHKTEFENAQKNAQKNGSGLWKKNVCK